MVLVNSSHEQQNLGYPPEFEEVAALQTALANKSLPILQVAASLGLLRVSGYLEPNFTFLGMPDDQRESVLAQFYRTGFYGAMKREVALGEFCLSQPGELKSFGDMPLYEALVLYKPYLDSPSQLTFQVVQQYMATMDEMQAELADLSTHGKRIVVEDTGHNIHLDQPKVVIDAIREVLEQAPK